jgi:streptogramin lyase
MGLEAVHAGRTANPVATRGLLLIAGISWRSRTCSAVTGDVADEHPVRPPVRARKWKAPGTRKAAPRWIVVHRHQPDYAASVWRGGIVALLIGALAALLAGCGGSSDRVDRKLGAIFRPDVASDAVLVPAEWDQMYPGARPEGCFCGVMRLDPRTGEVLSVVDLSDLTASGYDDLIPIAVTATAGSLWIGLYQAGAVVRVDSKGKSPLEVGGISHPTAMTVGAGSIWVASEDGTISRIDRRSASVTTIHVPEGLASIAFGFGSVWATGSGSYHEYRSTSVVRVDPDTNAVTKIEVGTHPTDIAIGRDAVWVSVFDENRVVRINPKSDRIVCSVKIPSPAALTVDRRTLWVATWDSNEVLQIDQRSLKTQARMHVRKFPQTIQTAHGALWITYADTGGENENPDVLSRLPLSERSKP